MSTQRKVGMDGVRARREELGLTQQEAAGKAGVSLATWRRLEAANDDQEASFRRATVQAVERVLRLPPGGVAALRAGGTSEAIGEHQQVGKGWLSTYGKSFKGDPLTPRQAFKLSMSVAGLEDDAFFGLDEYLQGKVGVNDLIFVNQLPDWVLFMVNGHWVDCFRDVLVDLGGRLDRGEVPYPRSMAERVALELMFDSAEEGAGSADDMLEYDDDVRSVLPSFGEQDEDWENAREQLFGGDFDFQMIWLPNFTRMLFGDSREAVSGQLGVELSSYHPIRWWETDRKPSR
ncbi:helix-turn-helix domain-containing protein [Amycolatopsis sacchari]|uniref:helix-turn-helix domain-containing protein n=1 Tax=Amycolatopsis sacchari TaxID=115433 RepID=UPI003D717A24